ncbi:MAG: hypothetical protein P1V97_10245 [Planctomycetota bacterium]|nr:hypothetical protein [Planctomycetota bacterium]
MVRVRFISKVLMTVSILSSIGVVAISTFNATRSYALGNAAKARCANNLRGIGLGLIQYSNENRFFPHMKALKTPNDEKDVSNAYRTLIYFKYIDEAKVFRCPANRTPIVKLGKAVLENPKFFRWGQSKAAKTSEKPIFSKVDPGVFQNSHLDYTYLRKNLNSSRARSDTIIAADKALAVISHEPIKCAQCKKSQDEGKFCMYCGNKYPKIEYLYCPKCMKRYDKAKYSKTCPTDKSALGALPLNPGNHSDGFNILFGDGHVDFKKSSDEAIMLKLVKLLHMGSFGKKKAKVDKKKPVKKK